MKSFELLLATVLIACVGLSFTHTNNFGATETTYQVKESTAMDIASVAAAEEDTLSKEELLAYINQELIEPIRNCFIEKDPHMFMTKCYTRIYFEPNQQYRHQRFYKNSNINGSLVLIDCSVESRMADIQINYNAKTIKVKESFMSPSISKDKYISNLCKYVKKNGVPKQF